jgi:hypothetical protein
MKLSLRSLFALAVCIGLLSACSMFSAPADLDLRLTRPSVNAHYVVSMRPLGEPAAINQIHAWEIMVTSSAGAPVADAKIAFSGGMPQHGHGYPTRPAVTAYLGEGRYRLSGVKFSMTGWWEMKLDIGSTLGADRVVFNMVVGAGAPQQLAAAR